MESIVDDSGRIPTIKNRRVSILDVMATMRINPSPEYQLKEVWDLSEDQIEEVKQYIEENRAELEDLESQVSEEQGVSN